MNKLALLVAFIAVALPVSSAHAELGSTRLSLPKGPGSIEGLASLDLSPSLASGQAGYSIPIVVPPAARAFGPNLALSYDSGAGVSELGLGWRLAGVPSIRRRTQDGLPRFDDTDSFELVGLGSSAELLEVRPGIYRPRYEDGSFVRVERGQETWEVRTKSGQVLSFGGPDCTSEEGGQVVGFLLRSARDLRGHEVRYEWRTTGGYPLLERIVWNEFGAQHRNEVSFQYEKRPDPSRLFSSGIKQILSERLVQISVLHGGDLVRRYDLSYDDAAHPRLTAVALLGADGVSRLPAARFRYSSVPSASGAPSHKLVEMQDAPGRSPAEGDASLVDVNGDSLPDLLIGSAGAYESAINLDGVHWAPRRAWATRDSPSFSLSEAGTELADFDGDGAADLLSSGEGVGLRYLARSDELAFGDEVTVAGQLDIRLGDPNVRLADFDGDRRTDFARTTSSGLFIARNRDGTRFEASQAVGVIDPKQEVSFSKAGTDLCDINGDRVQDVCVLGSGSLVFYLGRGHGSFEPAEEATGVPTFEPSEAFSVRDLNGDGWDDLVHIGVTEVTYSLAYAEGRFGPLHSIEDLPTKGPATLATFADMNGSGSVDIVWVDVEGAQGTSWRYLELFPLGRAGLLTEIDSGLGKKQRIEYAAAAVFAAAGRALDRAWTSRLNVPLSVVARVTVETGLGDPNLVQEYRYGDGGYDPSERTFAGFGRAETASLGDESTPTLLCEQYFDVGLERRALRGALLFEEKRSRLGVVFSRQSHEYAGVELETALDGRAIEYGYRSAVMTELLEGAEEASVVTLSETDQDEFGNVILEANWGVIEGDDYLAGGDEAIAVRTFANDSKAWVLGYVASERLQDGAGETVAASRKYYDGEPFEGLELGQLTRGEVTREEAWIGPGSDAYQLLTATRHDAHGLPIETKDARGGGRFFGWDPAHTSLVSEGVKLEPNDQPESLLLVERARFDGRFGTLLEVTDYAGSVTHYDYDAFGRLSAVIRPGDSRELPTLRYRYQEGAPLSRIVTEARLESGETFVELREDVFDGLGRKRASFVSDAELWLLAGVGLYDARGQVRRTLVPRWVSEADRRDPPLQVDGVGYETWRDALTREVRTRSAEGVETRSSYEALRSLHWDGGQVDDASAFEHTPTVTVSDGQGRVISHERTLAGEVLAARYRYDAAGRLVQRTDPEGHEQRFSYDGRGRRVKVDDPDQGVHRFAYDSAGSLVSHEYPDGAHTTFSYDLADRLLSEDWDGDGSPEIVQEHDRGPRAHLGKLVRIQEPSGFVEHTYNERGLVSETRYQIEGQSYAVGSVFDAQGREVEHVYPDGSRIRIDRNARGQLSGYGELVRIAYGADGSETERRFSTGARVQSRHDQDGRRTGLEFRSAGGAALEHLTWSYDRGGNLVSLVDERADVSAAEDRSESYDYDNLYRLTGASGSWGATEWSYSPAGNLLARKSTLEEQHAPSLRYNELPHGPSAIAERKIAYDARGRMTTDGKRRYEWDGASQLVRVSMGEAQVESVFGQDGVRRLRRERTAGGVSSTTHFIDAWSEVKDGRLMRYVVHSGERIVRLGDGPRDDASAPGLLDVDGLSGLRRLFSWGLAFACALAFLFWATGRKGPSGRLLPGARRRTPCSLTRLGVPLLAVVLGGCGEHRDRPEVGPRIGALAGGDTLLVTDQVGSLLAEADSQGRRLKTVALSPYGSSRQDDSAETLKHAGTPRDAAVNLDHMGARFYSPDLGVWTSADPLALSQPERLLTAEFAAAHAYAYASLRPVTATDRDGRQSQTLIGAGIGAVAGASMEMVRQYMAHGTIQDWGRVGVAAAGGGVAGALVANAPVTGMLGAASVGAAGQMATGLVERLIESGGKSAGSLRDFMSDAATGAVGGVVAHGAGAVVKSVASKVVPAVPVAPRAGVQTARGLAVQEETAAAQSALMAARSGGEVYRQGTFGVQAAGEGQYWSFSNPAATVDYAMKMGMPSSAAPDWIMGGTLDSGAAAVTRGAPSLGVNLGGGMELVVQPGGVSGSWFHMP